jgi:hypothetical protein
MREIPTTEECEKWKLNKMVNPISGYKITNKSGKIYKTFKKICKDIKTPPHTSPEIPTEIPYKNFIINQDICYKWLKNPLINPFTNMTIQEGKGVYKNLKNACIELKIIDKKGKILKPIKKVTKDVKQNLKFTKNPIRHLKREPTTEECEKWLKNKLRNPISNIKIKKDGELYKELESYCKGVSSKQSISSIITPPKIDDIPQISSKIDYKPIKKEKKVVINENLEEIYYPNLDDEEFNKKLLSLKEIRVHKINKYDDIKTLDDFEKKSKELCKFEKSSFQYLMAHYLSYRTPYRSILLYYSVGVGKTCTAITIAESLLINHNGYDEPMIWVILPSAIEGGFKNQIFENIKLTDLSSISKQCTGDTYVKLANIAKDVDIKNAEKKIKKLIKSRYAFFTYEGFANFIDTNYISLGKTINDKVIIVDEAHNIRSSGNDKDENKRVYSALLEVCKDGKNNRLIFLTATPMYNEPKDIYNLFYLLLLNDKREELYNNEKIFDQNNVLNPAAEKFISMMASNYISYLRGKNPFNFAFKLSPKLSGFKILDKVIKNTENGNPIDKNDENWISNIDDGIITSQLTDKQINYLETKKMNEIEQNNFGSLQAMNIVYDGNIGSEGFNNFFVKVGDKEQLSVRYNSKYKNALSPSPDKLGLYSSKLSTIANIIKNTNGVIVIYSRFVWSGVIPFAITLEHMGFSREGTNNILTEADVTHNTTYPNIKYPKYCILSSSDPEIMGNTTINGLMSKINHPDNKDGSIIKVILITQVASEGLNFQNIREMHLIDAWFHFNRIDQIIGRGIRNCSHKNLSIENRNVTVFLHASINGYERETADIHAYRIATGKLYQTKIIDDIIKNNSIDCSLFKNINYFDKELFKLNELKITTSQGKEINYQLGDDKKYEPKCRYDLEKIKENSVGFREETYKHLGLNIRDKIRDFILSKIHDNQRFISINDIKEVFNLVDEKILMYAIKMSIYPNIIIDNITLIPHKDGIHIIDVIEDIPLKISLEKIADDEVKADVKLNNDFYEKIEKIKDENYNNAIISLYLGLDEITFKIIIEKIFKEKSLNKIDTFIENCFIREGVLITEKEVNGIPKVNKYIGFVNIFNELFEPLIYNEDGINHKNFNTKQLEQLKRNRRLIQKPNDLKNEVIPFGMILPKYIDKEKTNKMNVFKILTIGIMTGEKTGMVCQSFKKNEHSKMFKELGLKDDKNNKESYCYKIATELYKKNRMLLLPEYKPI